MSTDTAIKTVFDGQRVKIGVVQYDFVLNARLMQAIQELGLDTELRGTNVVARLHRNPKGGHAMVELRSGYFNGRTYEHGKAVKRIGKFLQRLANDVNLAHGEVAKLMLVYWVKEKSPSTLFAPRYTEADERAFVNSMRKLRASDEHRITNFVAFCLESARKATGEKTK